MECLDYVRVEIGCSVWFRVSSVSQNVPPNDCSQVRCESILSATIFLPRTTTPNISEQYFPTTPTFAATHDLENYTCNLLRYPVADAIFDLAAKFLFVSHKEPLYKINVSAVAEEPSTKRANRRPASSGSCQIAPAQGDAGMSVRPGLQSCPCRDNVHLFSFPQEWGKWNKPWCRSRRDLGNQPFHHVDFFKLWEKELCQALAFHRGCDRLKLTLGIWQDFHSFFGSVVEEFLPAPVGLRWIDNGCL